MFMRRFFYCFLCSRRERNLKYVEPKRSTLCFVMSILPAMGLWFLSIVSIAHASIFLVVPVRTAFLCVLVFFAMASFMMCSRLVDYQDNERSLFLHG